MGAGLTRAQNSQYDGNLRLDHSFSHFNVKSLEKSVPVSRKLVIVGSL